MKTRSAIPAVLVLIALVLSLAGAVLAAQPDNPTARADQGSFNKSQTGLDHQSGMAWLHDGPADPHVEWE